MLPGLPPEQANSAPLNEPTRLTSCSRHERIGPTKSWSRLCHTVAKRVGPAPHASKMMSASFRPVCGRAPGSLLTLTTSVARVSRAGSSSGRPVSGWTGGGSVVVGGSVVDVVEVDDDVDVDDEDDDDVVAARLAGTDGGADATAVPVVSFDDELPLQAASTSPPPASASRRRRVRASAGALVIRSRSVMEVLGMGVALGNRARWSQRCDTPSARSSNGTARAAE